MEVDIYVYRIFLSDARFGDSAKPVWRQHEPFHAGTSRSAVERVVLGQLRAVLTWNGSF
jgi:hypothetical protein